MIIDKIEHLKDYVALNPRFQSVVDFMANNDINSLPTGKHPIDGSDVFVNIQTAKGKAPDEATLETHDKMIDIQIPLDTEETFGYTQRDMLPDIPYNAEKDITKYPGLAAQSYVTCDKGMMAIFFPQDGHAPCIAAVPEFKKAIFKVRCND